MRNWLVVILAGMIVFGLCGPVLADAPPAGEGSPAGDQVSQPQSYDGIVWDIERNGGNLPNGYYVAPGQGRMPHDQGTAVSITRKLLELQPVAGSEVSTSVEFYVPAMLFVKAMQDGVVHDAWIGPDGLKHVILAHGDGAYLSHYYRLAVCGLEKGDIVTKGQQIAWGYMGCSVGYDTYVDGRRVALYPFRYFMASPSPYAATDFDFIQKPVNDYDRYDGSFTTVNVYPKGQDGGPVSVYIACRFKGGGDFVYEGPLYVDGNTYTYWWDPAWYGKTMEYFVTASREGVPGHWVSRPAQSDGSAPLQYYEILVRTKTGRSARPQ